MDRSISSVRVPRFFMDMMKRMSNSEKRIYFIFLCDLFLRESAMELEKMEQVCDSGSLMGELNLDTELFGEALITYGFQYGYDQECYELMCYELFNKNLKVKGVSFSRNFDKSILYSGNLRMQLGIELLLALFTDTENKYEGVLRCLWRTRPFPFITGEELFIMLKPHYEGDDPSLQDVCDAYVERNTIFEVPVKTQPRSLKDLSKIQIRKTLYEAKGINDEAIDSLQLPRILKNYLKLGED